MNSGGQIFSAAESHAKLPAKPSSSLQLRSDPRRNSDVLNEKGFHLVAPAPALTFVLAVVYCRPLERAANYPAVVRIIKSLKQLVQVLHKIFAGGWSL